MPFTAAQIATGSTYSLATFQKKEPIDQINIQHVTLDWLIKNKELSTFGNGSFKEPIFVNNGSNAQNYFGADQVTYNERNPAKWTDFGYANLHDGFWFDEDRLIAAGIHLSDDSASVPTAAEKESLVNLLGQSFRGLKAGTQEALAFEYLRDGSQSAKAIPGLANLIKLAPATGVVGGIDAATNTYWRNNTNTAIVAANVIAQMELTWKDCMRYGGMLPDFIVCGQAFYENYVAQSVSAVQRHLAVQGKGGAALDASVEAVNFHGIPLKWDPTFEALDALMSTTTQTKTCYFLNSKALKLRPLKGEWMRNRKPEGLPDRYVTYFGLTSKYGLTTNKRNALAVLTIA
ncbi:hypothetical protein RHOFW510R12_01485 [Rhodanobacter sp. FW510-R12]|uniref:phage major capsid protein n=1 Tax=unclassified Rhodanobacter TaxID=2621553 RepID=UPI0007A9E764|nr:MULTISPECIES: phage major capsid protein [unclassified Rhodanobacter]KZC17022.1 hypothetical protein RHOFW104R8_13355 [Rhodanobacter sp. FW104-R8]KZC28546.1 hypothetical protein RhoFW510T8_10595 [Rhodanobacter sp. FW510-T8]KZC32351.1 hypothetical protein RhoFW510R10_13030 [Rhodanobacter sp. FW510-R10]